MKRIAILTTTIATLFSAIPALSYADVMEDDCIMTANISYEAMRMRQAGGDVDEANMFLEIVLTEAVFSNPQLNANEKIVFLDTMLNVSNSIVGQVWEYSTFFGQPEYAEDIANGFAEKVFTACMLDNTRNQ